MTPEPPRTSGALGSCDPPSSHTRDFVTFTCTTNCTRLRLLPAYLSYICPLCDFLSLMAGFSGAPDNWGALPNHIQTRSSSTLCHSCKKKSHGIIRERPAKGLLVYFLRGFVGCCTDSGHLGVTVALLLALIWARDAHWIKL
jgi:hypothetical protein